MHKSVAALALLSAVSAQTTTVLWLIGVDPQPLDGSVIASDSTATTYSIACAGQTSDDVCGIPPSFTFTQGPSTLHYAITALDNDEGFSETIDVGCVITSSESGVCSGSTIGTAPSAASSSVTTSSVTNADFELGVTVTITAGLAAATTTAASTSTTSTSSSASSSKSSSNQSTGSSTGASQTTVTGSSRTSTGGVPRITGHTPWVVGGAVAALALAA